MKKFINYLLWGVAGVGAVLLLLTVTLRLVYPSTKLRQLVAEEVQKQLHREARIADIEISPWGLSVKDLRLSEVPNFSAGTFVAVDQTTLRWALWPLLSKTLWVEAFSLDKPQIELIRKADGQTFNVSDLAGASSPSPSPQPSPLKGEGKNSIPRPAGGEGRVRGWTWRVDEIHLRHGTIRFLDRSPAGQASTLSDIDLMIRGFSATRIQGRLAVGTLENPVYKARDFFAEWALRDIDASLGHLNGWMRLKQGKGAIENLSGLVAACKGARLAFTPILALQNLDRLGLIRLGLPDFSHLPIDSIEGDYRFQNGTMKIAPFRINSPQLNMGAQGYAALARGDLAIDVTMDAPQRTLLGDMHMKMRITGTLSHPKVDLESLKKKAFKATVQQLLQQPERLKDLGNSLKNIFK